ncbi:hypothetical protein HPP92_003421 [Vanilla planifolia]|uniref:Uncharacterized protein n=1 Tax=Vanilla planifolia TaxID=51239 RepID=A0A835VIX9_VANPL|nr:hypothetical protein HPP92_003421 [Vanilla planifolia]
MDGKASAAVGQSGLMALYDALFSQLDVTSSQLLVTDTDFKDQDFRMQLTETVVWVGLYTLPARWADHFMSRELYRMEQANKLLILLTTSITPVKDIVHKLPKKAFNLPVEASESFE